MTKLCIFEWYDESNKIIRCIVCGRTRKTWADNLQGIIEPCGINVKVYIPPPDPNPPPSGQIIPPPTIQRIGNFAKAIARSAAGGFEMCSEEQVHDRIHICYQCPFFIRNNEDHETGICAHMGCGCNLNTKVIFMNKAAHKSEKCPMDKWADVDKRYTIKPIDPIWNQQSSNSGSLNTNVNDRDPRIIMDGPLSGQLFIVDVPPSGGV